METAPGDPQQLMDQPPVASSETEGQQQPGGGLSTPRPLTAVASATKAASKAKRRGPRRSILPRPRQQGDIDGLCGFYAVINALRLAFEPHGGLSVQHEKLIWRSIVRTADRKWRFASLFLGGTHTDQFLSLARLAIKAAHRITGKKVRFRQLPRQQVLACSRSLNAVILALKAKGLNSIIAGIDSKYTSHWTVITGVSQSTLRVLDSDGIHYLKLDGCRLDLRPRPKGSPRYWVRIYGGIVVEESSTRARATAKKTPKTPRK